MALIAASSELEQPYLPKYAIFGHVGFDVSSIGSRTSRTPGGAAYYAMRAARNRGVRVTLVASLGADFPIDKVDFEDVDLNAVHNCSLTSPVFHQTYDKRNEIQDFYCEFGSGDHLSKSNIPVDSDLVFLTSCPPTEQQGALDRLAAQDFAGLVGVDTTLEYAAEFEKLVLTHSRKIDVLFCNQSEFEALGRPHIEGAKVVVKSGADGARLFDNGKSLSVRPAKRLSEGMFTGAGDVLASVFLCSLLTENDSPTALSLAVDFASSYVERGAIVFEP